MTTSNAFNLSRIFDGYAGRNRIINGNCNVAQRSSLVCSAGITGYGGPDRFFTNNGNSAGGQFTQSQGSITYNGVTFNAVTQTVNTAIASTTTTNYWHGISHRIEGFNCYDLLGQQITVSFIFNTNVSGTYSFTIDDGSSTNSYATTFTATANTPTYYSFVIPTLPTTLSIPNSSALGMYITIGAINTGTFQAPSLGSWISGNYISSIGATNWGATIGNFISVTNCQLEAGTIATPFERELYSITLQKCQRYFIILNSQQFSAYTGASGGSVTTNSMNWPVTMRGTPTVTQSGQVYSACTGFSIVPLASGMQTFLTGCGTSAIAWISLTLTVSAEI